MGEGGQKSQKKLMTSFMNGPFRRQKTRKYIHSKQKNRWCYSFNVKSIQIDSSFTN